MIYCRIGLSCISSKNLIIFVSSGGCFTEKKTIEMKIHKKDRFDYACYDSNIDYGL